MDLSCKITDDYFHLENDLEYILENILSEYVKKNVNRREDCNHLNNLYNTLLINNCKCDEQSNKHCVNCSHGTNYVMDKNFGELVLIDSQNTPDLIYECSHICACESDKCLNRLVQYGPRKFLKIVDSTKICSKGLITTQDIPKGAFICEYVGELLTQEEAKRTLRQNEMEHKMNYVLFLKEVCLLSASNEQPLVTIVNPAKKGNIGRYLNHSCEPNCHIISVRIDCPIPKIAIFSNRHIKSGEELCFNYNEGVKNSTMENSATLRAISCLCGSKSCLKYLPYAECY